MVDKRERRRGLASGSSGSSTANPSSVVSIPSAVPERAPAAGTRSIGRGCDDDEADEV